MTVRFSVTVRQVREDGSEAPLDEELAAALAAPAEQFAGHSPAPGAGDGEETLDLVRIGADGSPRWSRVWPTPEENPRHAGLELWMAVHGHQIVSRPASWFDRCGDENG